MADFSIDEVMKTIDELAPAYGVDPRTAKSIIVAENTSDGRIRNKSFSGDATNSNRTMGLGQVIPTTARGLQQAGFLPADWKFDPDDLKSQLSASLAAMKEMKGRQKNPDDPLELGAMYNGGNEAWKAYQAGKALNPETTQYLQKQRTYMADSNMTPQQIERAASNPTATITPSGSRKSSSTSVTSNVFDAGALDSFNVASGLLQDSITAAQATLGARGTGVSAAGDELQASILDAGAAAGASAMATATLKAAGEARRAALLTRANLNPEQNNNRMDEALQALDTTSALLEQKRPEIDRRMAVGFFDNPLEYIVNQVRLPGMIGEYNGLVGVQKDALQKFDAAQGIANSAINMSQAIDADQTLAAGAALSRAEVAKAQSQANVVNLQLQQKSAADSLQAVQLAGTLVDNTLKSLMLTKQVEAQKEGESEAAARAKGEQAALSEFNMLVKAAGGSGIAYDRFKQLTPKAREEILSANSAGKFGSSMTAALHFVNKYGNWDAMATNGQLAVRTWVNDTGIAVNKELEKKATEAKAKGQEKSFNPEKVQGELFDAAAQQYQYAASANMRGVPDANPYKINYPSLLKDPKWTGNAFVDLMNKYGPNGTEPQFANYDEQAFLQRAIVTAKLSGDPASATKKLASDISTFYKIASKEQQMITKPQMFGLQTPSKTYPVILPAFSTGKDQPSLDLGNPTQVENFLTRQIAKSFATDNLSIFAVGEKLQNRKSMGLSNFGN